MKRFTSILLVSVMVLALALTMIACGGSDVTTTAATTTQPTVTTTTKKTTTTKPPIIVPKPPKAFDAEGEGTADDPFIIDSKELLLALVEKSAENAFTDFYFKQTADIVLNDTSVEGWYDAEDAQQWGVIKQFGGVYDGDGHVIEGLLINTEWNQPYESMMLGFIGESKNCTVKNLAFKGLHIDVAYGADATGTITSASVAGVVAFSRNTATIENCVVDCYINAVGDGSKNPSGGALFGYIGGGITVKNCLAIGEVNTNHGVLGSGGSGNCSIDGVVSLLTSNYSKIGDWSGGIACTNVYAREDGPNLEGTAWNFDASCAKVALADLTGDAAATACAGLDFENVWQVNDGKLPSLKLFGEKLIFDVPAAPAE